MRDEGPVAMEARRAFAALAALGRAAASATAVPRQLEQRRQVPQDIVEHREILDGSAIVARIVRRLAGMDHLSRGSFRPELL
ncbi:MAG TPA: hypothetical protein VE443_13880, partial [Beijerinckiaceae bacterium]|nr:hypothetical protein [Beijerinckiaceae bacterium]